MDLKWNNGGSNLEFKLSKIGKLFNETKDFH